jgi:hypothetical protein
VPLFIQPPSLEQELDHETPNLERALWETWQAVRYACVTPVAHTGGGALRICRTRYSRGRRCVTFMLHPSLTRQAVRYVYVTPVTHPTTIRNRDETNGVTPERWLLSSVFYELDFHIQRFAITIVVAVDRL